MSYLSSETQITQTGQAIRINAVATSQLSFLYSSNIGPHGTLKMLISPSQAITITKDGSTLCKEVQFTHPTSITINKAAQNLSNSLGDGTSSFIVLCCEIFNSAFKYFNDGTGIHKICSGMQSGMKEVLEFLNTSKLPADESTLTALAYTSLRTKVDKNLADILCKALVSAINNISKNEFFDINMIEVMKMQEGDPSETRLVDGLVLDHGGRHPMMPTDLEDVYVLITNLSLEYEKPEINSQFYYTSAAQRDALVASERKYIFERAQAVAKFGREVMEKTGKKLMVVTERGIDPLSLEVLSSEKILGLRRAKRRNLERLVKMCGGNIISRLDELKIENLGYCGKVTVKTIKDDMFTFIEKTPFKGSCTILVRGNSEHEMQRMISSIKGTVKSLAHALRDKVYLKGGPKMYFSMCEFLNSKIKQAKSEDVVGYKVLKESLMAMARVLIRNSEKNIEEEILKLERGEFIDEGVVDNFCVVTKVIFNSCMVASTLLMVDEIIKAGKALKEEKQSPN